MVVARVRLIEAFTSAEAAVVELVAEDRLSLSAMAKVLQVSPRTVEVHIMNAARKIPGTVPQKAKLIMWHRGRTIEDLHAWGSFHRRSGRRKCACGYCDDTDRKQVS